MRRIFAIGLLVSLLLTGCALPARGKQQHQATFLDLFDTVTVDVPMYGSSTTARVTRTQFNVLEENYKKISVGNLLRRLDRTIAQLI